MAQNRAKSKFQARITPEALKLILGLSLREIKAIIQDEQTHFNDYEYYMTDSSEDLRHINKVSKRGVVNIEL
jgi:hypothetical protein